MTDALREKLREALDGVVLTGDSASGYIPKQDCDDIADALVPVVREMLADAPAGGWRETVETKLQRIVTLCARPSNVDHIERIALEAIAALPPPPVSARQET